MLVIHSLSSGGAERVLVNLANHWASNGHRVTVATLAPRSADFYALSPSVARIDLDLMGESRSALEAVRANVRRVRILRRVVADVRPDIAIGFTSVVNVLLALASLRTHYVTIGSEHVHPPRFPLGKAWNGLRAVTYRRLDAVVVLTEDMRRWIMSHTSARGRVRVIPNPVWPLSPSGGGRPPEAVLPPRVKLLLAAGRLVRQKGFDLLIDAFSALAERHTDWTLVILGEGEERHALEAQVERLRLAGRVLLPGVAGNIEDWYRRADIYVMSSRFEGFGNTLAEALAVGAPAVSFDCETGPGTIIRDGLDGLLVPPEDIPGLTAALDRLMRDDVLRARLAERAIEARDRFSVERIAREWEALFDELSSGTIAQST